MKNTTSRIGLGIFALIFAATITTTFTACTAKRAEIFTQGQGEGLDTVEAWKERIVAIDTGKVIGASPSTHAQDSVKIAPSVKSMNHFDLVELKMVDKGLAALVGNPPFRGRPDTTGVYSIKIKLTDNYLKFYKVAKPEDLPFEEHSYTEETLPDGRISIPMVGYKIKDYFRIEAVKTSDDLDSHHLTEISEPNHSKATHVRIDWASKETFDAVQTLDLIPSSLFFAQNMDDGTFKPYEWYYAETVMDKSLTDTETRVGDTASRSEQSALIPATKVMFVPRENELRVVNVAQDERMSREAIQKSDDVNAEATLTIPVSWNQYDTKADGVNLSMAGEVVNDKKWNQRDLLEMILPEMKSTLITGGTTRLLDIEIDQNYFSFTVINTEAKEKKEVTASGESSGTKTVNNQTRKIHYSFLRADQGRTPYAPKRSFKSDQSLFGFFTSEKPFISNWEYYSEQDFDKRIYVSRMNPDAKEVVFHLSMESPKELEDVAERAVAAWNKTFQEALKGTGKEMKISFSKVHVQLGDLRYNVIHLVDTLNEDGLLGFGPSVADPETGEIVAATTNVYVNSTRAIAVSTVRQYIIDRIEKRFDPNAKSTAGAPITTDPATFTESPTAARFHAYSKNLKDKKVDSQELSQISLADIQKDLKSISKKRCQFGEQAVMNANDTEIKNYCPDVEKVIENNISKNFTDRNESSANWESLWTEAKPAIATCAKAITRAKLLSTLIHEIGHNFGLRHNFYGSYDKQNFKKITTMFGEEIVAHSSSIMEYTDWAEDRLTETGPYDIAAIRFGYGEQVETKDGKMIVVDTTKSLDNKNLKPYLFCSDEVAYTGLSAFCKTDDAGTNPTEVVKFYIEKYKRSEAVRKLRRARPQASDSELLASRNLDQTFLPLKNIYDEWRYELGEYVRKSARYLSDFDSESYKAMLVSMSTDPQYGPIYAQYHDAADLIFNFFKEVSFGPNEYCLINSNGEKRVIELERLRDRLSEATRGVLAIRTCMDAKDASELAGILGAKAPVVLGVVGYPINSYRFEQAQSYDDYLRDDVVGNETTRLYAGLLIHKRMYGARNIINGFAPNMTDEPTYYQDFRDTLKSRLIDGVNLKAFEVDQIQPLFTQESDLISNFAIALKRGMITPTDRLGEINQVVSRRKLTPFAVYQPTAQDRLEDYESVLMSGQRALYGAYEENSFSSSLISQFKVVSNLVTLTANNIYAKIMQSVPPAANLPDVVIDDFVSIVSLLKNVEKTFPDYAKCVESQVPTLAQLNVLIPQLVADYQTASGQGDAAVKKLLATSLTEYMKDKLAGKEFLYTQENLKSLAPVMIACLKDDVAGAALRKVSRNSKDYESQKSMILNVLGSYAD